MCKKSTLAQLKNDMFQELFALDEQSAKFLESKKNYPSDTPLDTVISEDGDTLQDLISDYRYCSNAADILRKIIYRNGFDEDYDNYLDKQYIKK